MLKHKKTLKGFFIALTLIMFLNLGAVFMGNDLSSITIIPKTQADENAENVDPQEPVTIDDALSQLNFEQKMLETKEDAEPENNSQTVKKIVQDTAAKVTTAHRIFAPLINYFAFQIGNFLGNDYIYQGAMGDMLHKIWIISRNLVNIAFVFYLLWIAVQTIFKQEGGMDDLKKNLITFTIGLIAVNFSWLATKVVLDGASVVTHAVFAIPSGIGDPPSYEPCQVNTTDKNPLKGVCYPTKIFAPTDVGNKRPIYVEDKVGDDDDCSKLEKGYSGEVGSAYNFDSTPSILATPENKALQGRMTICVESLNLFKYDQNTAVIYLTYGMARIQNLVQANSSGGDYTQFAIGALMSMALQVVYGIALGALFVALIIRMMMLWLLVGFSPFIVLLIGMGGEGGGEEIKKYLSLEQFISWAFVPAKVGAIFVVAFIMISAGQSMGDLSVETFDKLATQSSFVFKIIGQESLFAGIGSLQNLLWLIMTTAVLWLGVFAVLGKLEVVGSYFSRLGDFGKDLAVKVATIPYWMPILPLGKGGTAVSAKHALGTVTGISSLYDKYRKSDGMGGGTPDEKPSTKMYEGMKKLKYKDYEDKVNLRGGEKFTPEDGAKIAKEFNMNFREFMGQTEGQIKSGLMVMPGIDGDSGKAQKFYDALVTANGGQGGRPGEAAAEPSPLDSKPIDSQNTEAQVRMQKAIEDQTRAIKELKDTEEELINAKATKDKAIEEADASTLLNPDLKVANEEKKEKAQTDFDLIKTRRDAAEEKKNKATATVDELKLKVGAADALKPVDGAPAPTRTPAQDKAEGEPSASEIKSPIKPTKENPKP